jgi:hypothetical protein
LKSTVTIISMSAEPKDIDLQEVEKGRLTTSEGDVAEDYQRQITPRSLKLDQHGLPLIPQPSDDPLDPLNWSQGWKWFILLQASTLAFLGPFW